ncbi:MAG: hypothetical protein L0F96_08755 [Lactococcus lactis]|nr:hypothetical protein [Lactococcus lactis]MDN5446615.1 hypothetical protein [Lactococcus lactis]
MIENYFDFKKNGLFIVLKGILLSLFFLILYVSLLFMASTDYAINRDFSMKQNVNLYSLIDTFSDPNDFSKFRDSVTSIQKVSQFYNQLNQNQEITFLSIFDQPVPIANFKGGIKFDHGYETDVGEKGAYFDEISNEKLIDIKSLQMNEKAFSFYNLKVSKGTEIPWDNITYTSSQKMMIPVILGSNYLDSYAIGDQLKGTLYFETFDFKVVGFLAENSSVYYKNDINKFIDSYMIIPYPNQLSPIGENDKFFSGILNFAMINGDIAASKKLSTDNVLSQLDDISKRTKFDNYTLLNTPSYLIQFNLMRRTIQKNWHLVTLIIVLMCMSLIVVLIFLNLVLLKKRYNKFKILWYKGVSQQRLAWYLFLLMMKEYMISYLVFLVVYAALSIRQENMLKILLIVQTCCFMLDYLLIKSICQTKLKEISSRA